MTEKTIDSSMTPMETKSEIRKYLQELNRISSEIEERYNKGDYIQVISSLAALPNLHRMIQEECVSASQPKSQESPAEQEDESYGFGMYLWIK